MLMLVLMVGTPLLALAAFMIVIEVRDERAFRGRCERMMVGAVRAHTRQ